MMNSKGLQKACALIAVSVLNLCAQDAGKVNWVTPKRYKKLTAHPRLYVAPDQIERMVAGRGGSFTSDYEIIAEAADTGIRDADRPMAKRSPFDRGFKIQGRLLSLAIQWHRTKERKYLEAALKNIQGMKDWIRPGQPIQLWEGQFIAGLAIAYDLFYNDLKPEERQVVVAVGRQFARAWLAQTGSYKNRARGETGSWWMYRVANWNPVCCAGAGMLGFAMYEELDEAQTLIDRVDASLKPIFSALEKTEGGWVEGLGYWNWTMHYISLFGISFERATKLKHPGFRSEGFRKTLSFGTYFVPHRVACGFGDNQHGRFSSSLLAALEHLGYNKDLMILKDHWLRMGNDYMKGRYVVNREAGVVDISYGAPQKLLIEPDPLAEGKGLKPKKKVSKYFPEQGWGMIADQWPKPTIYASIRGGICAGDHTHADLLSWHALIGAEKMIHNIYQAGYYPTAFRSRSRDIYERNQTSKNTLFIAGVSAYTSPQKRFGGAARAKTTSLMLPTGPAMRLEAANAFWYGEGRRCPKVANRLFAILDDKGLLVLDRVETGIKVPVEARAYTQKKATFGKTDVLLEGAKETARLTFACDQPVVLRRAVALTTSGAAEPPTMIRFQTRGNVSNVTLATLLTRSKKTVRLSVNSTLDTVTVSIAAQDWKKTLIFTNTLAGKESHEN